MNDDADTIGPPIRGALKARAERANWLYRGWFAEQGHRIKAARHQSVYGACVLEAVDLCRKATERTARVILTAEQIALCEGRALSSERAHRQAMPQTNEACGQRSVAYKAVQYRRSFVVVQRIGRPNEAADSYPGRACDKTELSGKCNRSGVC